MRAGSLDRRITVSQKSAPTRNAMNEPVEVWTVLGTFAAEEVKRRSMGTEVVQAGQVRVQLHRTWRIRWTTRTASISPLDRVQYSGVEYEIQSATEMGRREGIEIMAIGPVPDTAAA